MQPQDQRYWQPAPPAKPEVSTGQAWVNMALLVMVVINLLLTGYIFLVVHGLVEWSNNPFG